MTPSHTDTTLYRCNSAIERYVIYRLGNYDSIRLCLVGIIVRNSFDFRSNLICCSPSLDISFIIQTHDIIDTPCPPSFLFRYVCHNIRMSYHWTWRIRFASPPHFKEVKWPIWQVGLTNIAKVCCFLMVAHLRRIWYYLLTHLAGEDCMTTLLLDFLASLAIPFKIVKKS